MKCIDTTYFVDLIRRPSAIRTITAELDEEGVHATTVFNVYEALFGTYAVKDDEKRGKARMCPVQTPTLMPIGIIALFGLLSVIVAMSIRKKKR